MKKIIMISLFFILVPFLGHATPPPAARFYSSTSTLDGGPVPVGTVITAFGEGDSEPCGSGTVVLAETSPGVFVNRFVFNCNGDDPATTDDDGRTARVGDTITFYMQVPPVTPDSPRILAAVTGGSDVWASGLIMVNLAATTGCSETSDCNDEISCTDDSCDHDSTDADSEGCVHTPNDASCDDGSECTTDACDVTEGCQNTPVDEGTPCDDDNPCTQTDECSATGTCVGSNERTCAPVDSCHLAGTCNTVTGDCVTGSEITACQTEADGCCPTACNANNDGDCDPFCGNTVIESGEDCDDANSIQGDGCQNDCTDSICLSRAEDDCSTGLQGVCAAGRKTCTDGVWGACVQITLATGTDADCDGQDDDCDGTPDDDYDPPPTTCGIGACTSTGEVVCEGDHTRDTCEPGDSSEETCNGADDDCDGATDEVDVDRDGYLACAPADPATDTTPRDCNDGDSNIKPGADELCDGIDNNCDTVADEEFNLGEECALGSGACETEGEIACNDSGGTKCEGSLADGNEIADIDSNPCTRDTCVEGEETHSSVDDETICEDGNVCTTNDLCTDGLCVSGDDITPADEDENSCTVESCEPPDADPGLVAHWTFEEGSGTTLFDLSGNNHHGVIFGDPVWADDGKIGKALVLDGTNDYVRIPNSPTLNPADELTIAAWYKPDSFVGVGNNAIVDKGATSHASPFYQYHLGVTGDDYHGNARASFSFSVSDNTTLTGSSTPHASRWESGQWYHLVATHNRAAGTLKIYVNSVLVEESSEPTGFGAMQDVGKDVFIGAFSNLSTSVPANLLKGTVDDIRLYSRELTVSQIADLFERTRNFDVAVEDARNETECDDGDLCTVGDSCQDGACTAEESRSCDDVNPCTDDSCDSEDPSADSETGCVHTNNTESCSDGDACNGEEVCIDGACPDGVSPDCDDVEPCTADSCDPDDGCVNTVIDRDVDGTADCNDACPDNRDLAELNVCGGCTVIVNATQFGQPCTLGEGACSDDGKYECQGTAAIVCNATPLDGTTIAQDPPPPCSQMVCRSGIPTNEPFPNRSPCNADSNACTENDTCQGGVCVAGAGKTVPEDTHCIDYGCVPATGDISSTPKSGSAEICNGADDDCDGQVDDGFTLRAGCEAGDGACKNAGTIVCKADGTGTECSARPGEPGATEICGDDIDNNCAGGINEGCICVAGETKACGSTDTGDCEFGKETCTDGKAWGICVGAVLAQPEACDGRDNDCNGKIDETPECEALKECVAGDTRPCGRDEGACETGLQTCTPAGKWGAECADEVKPVAEVCDDGEDNDCDKFRDDRDPDCVELCPDETPPVASLCTIDVTTEAGMDCRDSEGNTVNSFTGFQRILALASDSKWNLIVHDITDHIIRIDTRTGESSLLTDEPMPVVRDLAMDKLGNTYIAAGENLVKVAADKKLSPLGKIEGLQEIAIVKDAPFLLDESGKIHKLVEEKDEQGVAMTRPTLLTDLATLSEKPEEGAPELGGFIGDGKYLYVLLTEKNLVVSIDPETGSQVTPTTEEKAPATDEEAAGEKESAATKPEPAPMTPEMIRQKMGPVADVFLCVWKAPAQPPCMPEEEICDGIDNDCDSIIDNGFDEDGDGVSICADDCDDTNALVYPNAEEACDGYDNNCDFCTDENCECIDGEERACGIERGECHEGTHACVDGVWQANCDGWAGPTPELCDGLDNNCNGRVDEGIKQEKVTCGVGACAMKGKKVCEEEKMVEECVPGKPLAQEDSTCNGIDDDCDGKTDEDCQEVQGGTTVQPLDKPIDGDVPPDGQGATPPEPDDGASWLTGGGFGCSVNPQATSGSAPIPLAEFLLALVFARLLRRRSPWKYF